MIYFCPTPLGNLQDITLRTLEVLRKVDYILAEDTRVTLKLLSHFQIQKKLIAYHKFNEKEELNWILEMLREGKQMALVTDAGMPGISDPGTVLIRELIQEDIEFEVLPGPNAAITALVQSGLPTDHFLFYGFLPSKSNQRKKELESLKNFPYTSIYYESPHRVTDCLQDIVEIFGDRNIALCREMTKLFGECIRGSISDILAKGFMEKGEFVIVVEGAIEEPMDYDIPKLLREKMEQGISKSQAVKQVARENGLPKNEVYKESLHL